MSANERYSFESDPNRRLGAPMSRPRAASVTTWLIVLNVAIFLIDQVLFAFFHIESGGVMGFPLAELGHFSVEQGVTQWQVWRVVTFQFLHADPGHLMFNMLALYLFGPMVEHYLASGRFLAFYLIGGVGGVLMYLALWWMDVLVYVPQTPLVGASAGIFAILAAAAKIAPDVRVNVLLLPIPIKLRTLVGALIVFAIVVVAADWDNAGGEAGHLGGALLGLVLIRNPQ
jgi:membrane associated rhomboid family serine protease